MFGKDIVCAGRASLLKRDRLEEESEPQAFEVQLDSHERAYRKRKILVPVSRRRDIESGLPSGRTKASSDSEMFRCLRTPSVEPEQVLSDVSNMDRRPSKRMRVEDYVVKPEDYDHSSSFDAKILGKENIDEKTTKHLEKPGPNGAPDGSVSEKGLLSTTVQCETPGKDQRIQEAELSVTTRVSGSSDKFLSGHLEEDRGANGQALDREAKARTSSTSSPEPEVRIEHKFNDEDETRSYPRDEIGDILNTVLDKRDFEKEVSIDDQHIKESPVHNLRSDLMLTKVGNKSFMHDTGTRNQHSDNNSKDKLRGGLHNEDSTRQLESLDSHLQQSMIETKEPGKVNTQDQMQQPTAAERQRIIEELNLFLQFLQQQKGTNGIQALYDHRLRVLDRFQQLQYLTKKEKSCLNWTSGDVTEALVLFSNEEPYTEIVDLVFVLWKIRNIIDPGRWQDNIPLDFFSQAEKDGSPCPASADSNTEKPNSKEHIRDCHLDQSKPSGSPNNDACEKVLTFLDHGAASGTSVEEQVSATCLNREDTLQELKRLFALIATDASKTSTFKFYLDVLPLLRSIDPVSVENLATIQCSYDDVERCYNYQEDYWEDHKDSSGEFELLGVIDEVLDILKAAKPGDSETGRSGLDEDTFESAAMTSTTEKGGSIGDEISKAVESHRAIADVHTSPNNQEQNIYTWNEWGPSRDDVKVIHDQYRSNLLQVPEGWIQQSHGIKGIWKHIARILALQEVQMQSPDKSKPRWGVDMSIPFQNDMKMKEFDYCLALLQRFLHPICKSMNDLDKALFQDCGLDMQRGISFFDEMVIVLESNPKRVDFYEVVPRRQFEQLVLSISQISDTSIDPLLSTAPLSEWERKRRSQSGWLDIVSKKIYRLNGIISATLRARNKLLQFEATLETGSASQTQRQLVPHYPQWAMDPDEEAKFVRQAKQGIYEPVPVMKSLLVSTKNRYLRPYLPDPDFDLQKNRSVSSDFIEKLKELFPQDVRAVPNIQKETHYNFDEHVVQITHGCSGFVDTVHFLRAFTVFEKELGDTTCDIERRWWIYFLYSATKIMKRWFVSHKQDIQANETIWKAWKPVIETINYYERTYLRGQKITTWKSFLPCRNVNKKQGCRFGKDCEFWHGLQGRTCEYLLGDQICPTGEGDCPFSHAPSKKIRCKWIATPHGCHFGAECRHDHNFFEPDVLTRDVPYNKLEIDFSRPVQEKKEEKGNMADPAKKKEKKTIAASLNVALAAQEHQGSIRFSSLKKGKRRLSDDESDEASQEVWPPEAKRRALLDLRDEANSNPGSGASEEESRDQCKQDPTKTSENSSNYSPTVTQQQRPTPVKDVNNSSVSDYKPLVEERATSRTSNRSRADQPLWKARRPGEERNINQNSVGDHAKKTPTSTQQRVQANEAMLQTDLHERQTFAQLGHATLTRSDAKRKRDVEEDNSNLDENNTDSSSRTTKRLRGHRVTRRH